MLFSSVVLLFTCMSKCMSYTQTHTFTHVFCQRYKAMLAVTMQILGTFITEWEAGSILCELLLWTEQSAEAAALQLAKIAAFYGFDGWLLNIENPVLHRLIPNLIHFIRWVSACSCLLFFLVLHVCARPHLVSSMVVAVTAGCIVSSSSSLV